ncbi:MAG TPA: hypothetical protein P5531_10515 [Bacteroidales bacterium]|nr:hypothetical protein [Bacteroidales bacterium]HSA43605.1 hypothetical protein [Bacteroidales bacterium]
MLQPRFSLFKTVQILLPHGLRYSRVIAWNKAFVSYLAMLLESLYQFWDLTLKEIKMTPQIICLEYLLNNRYGTTEIYISDGTYLGPWIYPTDNEAEHEEFYLDQSDSFIWNNQDEVVIDFVVNVPEALQAETPIIGAIVQKYKLPGKHFIIQLFE